MIRNTLHCITLCMLLWQSGQSAPLAAAMLAPTPQMGFNNWNSTHCRPEFNETMIRGIADRLVSLGLRDIGYTYLNLDDCWAEPDRDREGNLVVNRQRFPDGLKKLADYIHARGLKFGLYTSAGSFTCQKREEGGFPGALDHEMQDAALMASFGVDYLKYDNCNHGALDARERYRRMAVALQRTGRAIFYSVCEWGENRPWLWAADPDIGANSWRTTGDIEDSFQSMLSNYNQNVVLEAYARPGHWNDPDMLEIGNGGMSAGEYRTHFSLWAIMAAPLLIGTDLRTIDAAALAVLSNREVIAIDQDELGRQGKRIRHQADAQVIVKPLRDGSLAVALFNPGDQPATISVEASELGLPAAGRYAVRDLWRHTSRDSTAAISARVSAHATELYRIRAAPGGN
jgi:alpha-galactosidase